MATSHEERAGPIERISTAMNSSNLLLRWRTQGDADVLIALGLASRALNESDHPVVRDAGTVGSSLVWLQSAGTRTSYKMAREAVTELVRKLNAIYRWNLNGASITRVAEQALAHHVNPACPHCRGRGKLVAEGTPYLTANICKHCNGTGRKAIQKRHRDEIDQTISTLDHLKTIIASAVARRLR